MANALNKIPDIVLNFFSSYAYLFIFFFFSFFLLSICYYIWLFSRQMKVKLTRLTILVPRDNPGAPFAVEQAMSSLHTKKKRWERVLFGPENYALEKEANDKEIFWSIVIPEEIKENVKDLFKSPYTNCEFLEESLDIGNYEKSKIFGYRIKLKKKNYFTIKTLKEFINAEPEVFFSNSVGSLKKGEKLILQIALKPVRYWGRGGHNRIDNITYGKTSSITSSISRGISSFLSSGSPQAENETKILTDRENQEIDAITGKITKLAYKENIRLYLECPEGLSRAKIILNSLLGYLYNFNIEMANGFERRRVWIKKLFWWHVKKRYFPIWWGHDILNIEEIACLWHLPNSQAKHKKIKWAGARGYEAELGIPSSGGVFLGCTGEEKVCLLFHDASMGVLVGGSHRTGKTTLIKNVITYYLFDGMGMSIYDPADDLWHVISYILPEYRKDDLVLFNATDLDNCIGMNMLELKEGTISEKSRKIEDVIIMFNHLWHLDEKQPRSVYYLRGCLKTLLELPQQTLLEVTLLLLDEKFRLSALNYIEKHSEKPAKDEIFRFWNTYSWTTKIERDRHISPILNKIGAFSDNDVLKLILGQTYSTLDHRKLFDDGKVIVYNLSLSKLGEESARILGTIALTLEWQAAKSREDLIKKDIKPRVHTTFIDEFPRFAAEYMAKELSMIRKYGVYFWIIHQYIDQFSEITGNEVIKKSIYGNQQNFLYFRVGAEDAKFLANFYEPEEKERPQKFSARDFTERKSYEMIAKIIVNQNPQKPFIIKTEPSVQREQFDENTSYHAVENSIKNYTKKRDAIYADIESRRRLVYDWQGENSNKVEQDEILSLIEGSSLKIDNFSKDDKNFIFSKGLEKFKKAFNVLLEHKNNGKSISNENSYFLGILRKFL